MEPIPRAIHIDLRQQHDRRTNPVGRRAADAAVAQMRPQVPTLNIGRRATDRVDAHAVGTIPWDRRFD